ncbi:MAG: hypothetical protein ACOC2U_04525, partial [bacterium]
VILKRDDERIRTKTKSKAFFGRGHRACIFVQDKKGSYSLKNVVPMEKEQYKQQDQQSKKQQEKHSSKRQYKRLSEDENVVQVETINDFQKLIEREIQANNFVDITQATLQTIFPTLHMNYGDVSSIDQFKIWGKENGYRVAGIHKYHVTIDKK